MTPTIRDAASKEKAVTIDPRNSRYVQRLLKGKVRLKPLASVMTRSAGHPAARNLDVSRLVARSTVSLAAADDSVAPMRFSVPLATLLPRSLRELGEGFKVQLVSKVARAVAH